MAEFKFGVKGQERKNFVSAVSEILNQPKKYLGTPSYAFSVGDYIIDREGTLIGEHNMELLLGLTARGFIQADISLDALHEAQAEPDVETVEPELEASEENIASEILSETAETEEISDDVEPEAEVAIETDIADRLTIEYPLEKFSPEKLDNLIKLIESKGTLIKQVLGIDELPIKVLNDRIALPWFPADADGGNVNAYAQFVSALCETAIKKSRVSSKPQVTHENPRFTMRIFLVGLGLIGREFDHCRKLMMRGLEGDSGHRFGKPDGETTPRQRDGIQREVISIRLTPDTLEKLNILASKAETETGQRTSRNMLVEQTVEAYIATEFGDASPEVETANVNATNADTAEESEAVGDE
jgi:predicted transcriptional regulator